MMIKDLFFSIFDISQTLIVDDSVMLTILVLAVILAFLEFILHFLYVVVARW
jgi:hypothetical protein